MNCSESTFAKTMKRSANPPLVIHIFSPLRTKLPSGCRTARAFAPRASEPDPDSLKRVGANRSRRSRGPGRYRCFCSSVPKQRSGVIASPFLRRTSSRRKRTGPTDSPTMIDETLSSSTPPYASGTSVPRRPRSPHRRTSARASAQSFCSSRSSTGRTSLVDELVSRLPDQPVLVAQPLGREDRLGCVLDQPLRRRG